MAAAESQLEAGDGATETAAGISADITSSQPSESNSTGPPRLIIVSNRLPVTISKDSASKKSDYNLKPSAGGLVSGLAGLLKGKDYLWYGWAGIELPKQDIPSIEARLKSEHSSVPVWFAEEMAERHYNGFSNEIMWALFHYHPGEFTFDESAWTAYQEVNQMFAERIVKDVKEGDVVWIHDYHLMLLPKYLRVAAEGKGIRINIGWFLHTPWPSSEVYRILPAREEMLQGLLHADLLGFHTWDYVRHFVASCRRLLKISTTPNVIKYEGRATSLGAFPIGIDPVKFAEGLNHPDTQNQVAHFRERFRESSVIFGCDRLDYIKAIPHKLHAFEHLLANNPDLVGKVQLVQFAVPSRTDVPEYQHLKRTVNELSGMINAAYGTIDFQPVHLKHTNCGHRDLMALFSISDICFITSIRDGMNLVAYEYIACQEQRHGTLVISEFAGCAQNFAGGAVVINPWDTVETAHGLAKACRMAKEQRRANHELLMDYVNTYTSEWWGNSFIEELMRITKEKKEKEEAEAAAAAAAAANPHDSTPGISVRTPKGNVYEPAIAEGATDLSEMERQFMSYKL